MGPQLRIHPPHCCLLAVCTHTDTVHEGDTAESNKIQPLRFSIGVFCCVTPYTVVLQLISEPVCAVTLQFITQRMGEV